MSDNREVKKALKSFKKDYSLSKKMDDLTIGFIVKHSFNKPSPVTPTPKKDKRK